MRPYCQSPKYCESSRDPEMVVMLAAVCTGCRLEAAWANIAIGLALAGLAATLSDGPQYVADNGRRVAQWTPTRQRHARAYFAARAGVPATSGGT